MVVHPAKGHWSGTLASALVHHFDQLSQVGGSTRPGIVHRLDRETTGVILVAKTDAAHRHLVAQFQARSVAKLYLAICLGNPDRDRDLIDQPIGQHRSHREKKAIRPDHASSRSAQTMLEVAERFPGIALMHAFPKTGRTHQVRLHLRHIRCPVLCDKLYGSQAEWTVGQLRHHCRLRQLARDLPDEQVLIRRQALHAERITIAHPTTGQEMQFRAPLPDDMRQLLQLLRQGAN
jgi:23S rRNA pseudouridine1911/1915/1917 synthase